jgi:hypothetical protein
METKTTQVDVGVGVTIPGRVGAGVPTRPAGEAPQSLIDFTNDPTPPGDLR